MIYIDCNIGKEDEFDPLFELPYLLFRDFFKKNGIIYEHTHYHQLELKERENHIRKLLLHKSGS